MRLARSTPLRYLLRRFIYQQRFTSDGKNTNFAEQMELFDTSIPTMEKILTILQDAESNKENPAEATQDTDFLLDRKIAIPKDTFHAFFGLKVLEYNIIRMLNDAEVVEKYSVFDKINAESCGVILKHHTETLRDNFIWLNDASILSRLGTAFISNPVRLSNELRPQLKRKAAQILVGFEDIDRTPKFPYDLPEIRLPNPFRGLLDHPMMIRKGLSLKKRPANLLCFLVDDRKFLEVFLGKLRSSLLPGLLLNIMKCQKFEGSTAFKLLLIKHLKNPESKFYKKNPLDAFGQSTIDELESEIAVLKAIVTHKSNLITRLDSFGIYKDSMAELDAQRFKSSEDIVGILARSFDRYFSACYRVDAKHCDEWVACLLTFYQENWKDVRIFEEYFKESINGFKDRLAHAALTKLQTAWTCSLHKKTRKSKKGGRQSLVSS